MAHRSSFDDEEFEAAQYKRLTAKEAQTLRKTFPAVSAWQVVGFQVVVGIVVALATWVLTQRPGAGWSAAYGAATAVVPAILFARGLKKQFSGANAAASAVSGMGFFVLEAVKIVITLVMFLLASRVIENLEWLALLAGLVVTLKVYWLALLVHPKPENADLV
jgi:ATP synthase protein I